MKDKGKNSHYKNAGKAPYPFPGQKKGETPEELKAKYDANKKKLIRRGPVLIVVAVFCVIMLKRPQPPDIVIAEHTYASFYSGGSGETVVLSDGRAIGEPLPGEIRAESASLDGGVYAALAAPEGSPDGTLLVFSPDGDVLLSEKNVTDFALATEGGAVAYHSSASGSAFIYGLASGGRTEIPASRDARDLRISPDGAAAAFTSGGTLYLWDGSGTAELGGGLSPMFPLTVSGGGERVYAVERSEGTLFLFTSGEVASELVSGVDIDAPAVASRDNTQILVHNDKSAIIAAGGDVYDVGGEGRTLPDDILVNARREPFGFTYGGFLLGIVYETSGGGGRSMYAVDVNGTSKRYISGSESKIRVRSNGGSAYYVRKGELVLFQNSARGGSIKTLDENVSPELVIEAGKKRVFYINNTGELRTLKGKGSPRLIADGAADVKAAPGKGAYYTTLEEELYYYNGGKSVKIADGVTGFTVAPNMICYFTRSGYTHPGETPEGFSDVYASRNGAVFELAAEGVRAPEEQVS
ncbi:MAG: hypothetical protein LBD49_02395 [Oscillospiraceae bacterium]|jgi:hypothetical protein|nr:hypothetical protein [Oscillospiraceae bacterium]